MSERQLPIQAKDIRSDDLTPVEIEEICAEITDRNLGKNTKPSEHATKIEEAHRQHEDEIRSTHNLDYTKNPFKRDARRIAFSKAYGRLAGKTQSLTTPTNPHITHRLTHTIKVAQIGKSIARALGANEDLVEAIAYGHDLGHAPFGHHGEILIAASLLDVRNDVLDTLGAFKHNVQSLHVVDRVEGRIGFPKGTGLNLTDQVRHGILSHDGEKDIWQSTPNPDLLHNPEAIQADIQRYLKEVIENSKKDALQYILKSRLLHKPEAIQKDIRRYLTKVIKEVINGPKKEDLQSILDPSLLHNSETTQADIQEYLAKVLVTVTKGLKSERDPKEVFAAASAARIQPATLEGSIVAMVDVLHYVPEDFEDQVRLGVIRRDELPADIAGELGKDGATMTNRLVNDLLVHSYEKGYIAYSERIGTFVNRFKREFLYRNYPQVNSLAAVESKDSRVRISAPDLQERMTSLFQRFLEALKDPSSHKRSSILDFREDRDEVIYKQKMEAVYGKFSDDELHCLAMVMDYIAGFTDDYFFSESNA